MFTGLIEQVGTLTRREARGAGVRLVIQHEAWPTPLAKGESVAINGACLTATEIVPGQFACDVLAETLRLTSLGARPLGGRVNLERAMRADGRFGGHLVAGHVDGLGTIHRLDRQGDDGVLEIRASEVLLDGILLKGSVAIDGISLTVTAVRNGAFTVNLIPFTWTHTALRDARAGDLVNLETDMIGKFVRKYVNATTDRPVPPANPANLDPMIWAL